MVPKPANMLALCLKGVFEKLMGRLCCSYLSVSLVPFGKARIRPAAVVAVEGLSWVQLDTAPFATALPSSWLCALA